MSSMVESNALMAGEGAARPISSQRKNLILASLGSMLEFYEFMVFGFLTVVIARQFFPAFAPGSAQV